MTNQEPTFWADQAASEIQQKSQKRTIVATGITPSGEIHIGNLREVVTADAVVRALKDQGQDVTFHYIADTFDPLRRVYPFLDETIYAEHVGKPISEIPCPCGKHESYAEHFLEPFLASMEELGMPLDVVRADRMYKEGRYVQNIIRALEHTNEIRAILKKETGKETDDQWSPFNPICNACGRMTTTQTTGFDAAQETVNYTCECGDSGEVSMRGGGKLTWRVDWPARWEILGVTVEPFGKDHASRGGSYDTGKRMVKEIFDFEAPFPVIYEWISLKGGGDMSSSKGNVLSIHEMLEVVPPEVLKYMVIKTKPNRRIVFDPGLPLLQLIDEYDDHESRNRNVRAAELAEVRGVGATGVPFRHLVSLAQTTQDDVKKVIEILERTGYPIKEPKEIEKRVQYARRWLDKFAPEDVKFTLQESTPEVAKNLSDLQKQALREIIEKLEPGLTAQDIHSRVYEVKEKLGLSPKELFEAIYLSLLGKAKGPRAGFFLASLEPEFVKKRFKEVI